MQTPPLRRTGAVPAYAEPKKSGIVGTIFGALLLLGVIAYGAYKLRPVFDDARQHHDALAPSSNETPVATSETTPSGADAAGQLGTPQTAAAPSKPSDADVEKTPPKKLEPVQSSKATQFKQHIEDVIAERGMTGKAKVQGVGNTLILEGKLRPSEHGELLKLLRDAPADVHVVDHIEYDDTPAGAGETADEGSHPVPWHGLGAIHLVTDVVGATAVLRGPRGHTLKDCQTPCSFNNLIPVSYTHLDVYKRQVERPEEG